MSRRALSARISPGVDLHEIRIKLAPFGPPAVELHGRVSGIKNRRVSAASMAVIHTMHLTEEGERFIESMKNAFASADETKEQT